MLDPNLLCTDYPGEDQEQILKFFEGEEPGFFVDVGALNGFHLSQTRALWQKGWSGVFVEPDSRAFGQLFENYSEAHRVRLVNAAVSDFNGGAVFYENKESPTWSSMDRRWVQKTGRDKFEPRAVIVRRLDALELPERIDFLCIDTEGLDLLIVTSMPADMQPRLILVETNKEDGGLTMDGVLSRRGYRQVWTSPLNAAYAL